MLPLKPGVKMKQKHLLLMALCCLAPLALIIGFSAFFRGSSSWVWLIILLCPVLHILMMRGHQENEAYKCPECGLEYLKKEWAEKCEAWCKEHKSCNLEIIEHAINKGRK